MGTFLEMLKYCGWLGFGGISLSLIAVLLSTKIDYKRVWIQRGLSGVILIGSVMILASWAISMVNSDDEMAYYKHGAEYYRQYGYVAQEVDGEFRVIDFKLMDGINYVALENVSGQRALLKVGETDYLTLIQGDVVKVKGQAFEDGVNCVIDGDSADWHRVK